MTPTDDAATLAEARHRIAPVTLSPVTFDASTIPDDPHDPFWRGDRLHPQPPWPEWVSGFRPWQIDACREIVDAFTRGQQVVFLDAPTGTGKTVIGEMVRRAMVHVDDNGSVTKTSYICHTKRLQDQFLRDFDYARLIKGRSNYPTELGPENVTAADCNGGLGRCVWCDEACPYLDAKAVAMAADLCVANTSYWLHEVNYVRESELRGRWGLVIDECDVTEGALMGFVEVVIGEKLQDRLRVGKLKKGVHTPTVIEWLEDVADKAKEWTRVNRPRAKDNLELAREVKAVGGMVGKIQRLVEGLRDEDTETQWVRDYPAKNNGYAVIFKPVKVDEEAVPYLWRNTGINNSGWVLMMSASIVSADELADSLGMSDIAWELVRVNSPFPVENRIVQYAGVGNMANKTLDADLPKVVAALGKIVEQEETATLIHTVSYKLTRVLADAMSGDEIWGGRPVYWHVVARDRDELLDLYVRDAERGLAPVIISPSLDRGVDLPGELCRCQVIVKVPFPYLGDRQVSERLYSPGGQGWFNTQVARTLIQMTGRGVRSADDWCVTWILDKQFGRWWRDGKRLMPRWWAEGVKAARIR